MKLPFAPSGLHQAPGYIETPTEAGDVEAGEVAVGEVAAGDVSIVPISGASDHGAITNPAHDELSRFLIRPHSL